MFLFILISFRPVTELLRSRSEHFMLKKDKTKEKYKSRKRKQIYIFLWARTTFALDSPSQPDKGEYDIPARNSSLKCLTFQMLGEKKVKQY